MKRYAVRPARLTDLEAVHDLILRQNTADYGSVSLTTIDLEQKWRNLNLAKDTCVAFAGSELAGYAELLDGNSPYIYLADRSNVDLAYQLLTILEGRVFSQKQGKVDLFTRVSEKNTTLLRLFASSGYQSKLSFLVMETVLDELPPAPYWPDGIKVRRFVRDQDEQAVYRADAEAAEDKGYHDPLSYEGWAKRMGMDREGFDPSLWFLACAGDEITGVALNLYDRKTDTGWVDHLGVQRTWRNRGIGRALLLHTFYEFYIRHIHRIRFSVDSKSLTNAPHLYESVGMKTVQQYHIYRKEL